MLRCTHDGDDGGSSSRMGLEARDAQLGHGDSNSGDVPAEVGAARFRAARVVFAAAGSFHS